MKKNTIEFQGERTSVSSSGNVEEYEFTILSRLRLCKECPRQIGEIHGMGGQDFTCDEYKDEDLDVFVYKCKATCYCD